MWSVLKRFLLLVLLIAPMSITAQTELDFRRSNSIDFDSYRRDTIVTEMVDTLIDKSVVTNPFWHNWFVTGEFGYNSFVGDFSEYGKFKDSLSPKWSLGIGKWFTPTFGIDAGFGIGTAKGYTNAEKMAGPFWYGDMLQTDDGTGYYRTNINYWDANVTLLLNLSRMICGYEGPNSKKLMNQFIIGIGLGAVHHYDFEHGNPKLNEWTGKFEIGYSRFLNRSKSLSIDLRASARIYPTNFDGNFDFIGCNKFDKNFGASIGMTYYIRPRVWDAPTKIAYQTEYNLREVKQEVVRAPQIRTMSFYVMYPDGGEHDLSSLAADMKNDNTSLNEIRNSGYTSAEGERLYSLADIYAAITGNAMAGASLSAVNELKDILSKEVMTKITVMSMTKAIDYYNSDIKLHEQNSKNITIANQRANDVVEMLKKAPRMNTATSNIMLVNSIDINKEQCVKVTIQYLSSK